MHAEVPIALEDAFLLLAGLKAGGWNARRKAGLAMLAMGPVQMFAAAPEAQFRKAGIHAGIERVARIEKQGGRLLSGEVAAVVRLGRIELQMGQFGHDVTPGSAGRARSPVQV
ncbi:hypothetical protein D3C84_1084660 [compost metagenome]